VAVSVGGGGERRAGGCKKGKRKRVEVERSTSPLSVSLSLFPSANLLLPFRHEPLPSSLNSRPLRLTDRLEIDANSVLGGSECASELERGERWGCEKNREAERESEAEAAAGKRREATKRESRRRKKKKLAIARDFDAEFPWMLSPAATSDTSWA